MQIRILKGNITKRIETVDSDGRNLAIVRPNISGWKSHVIFIRTLISANLVGANRSESEKALVKIIDRSEAAAMIRSWRKE